MVLIMKKKPANKYEYYCGGSLIHPSVVLTSAHNMKKPYIDKSSISVRAGDWDIRSENEEFDSQDSKVKSIVIHEQFNAKTLWNDVALLFLEKPFLISTNINTICLPPQNQRFDNTRCIVTGWGKNNTGKAGKLQAILNYVEVPIVSHRQCQESLDSTEELSNNFRLHESFICAGREKGKDSCQGDGGSPLICPISNKEGYYYQAGIVSWGIGCGIEGLPGIYTKVSKFRNWIDGKLNERGLSTDSYKN